MQKRVGNIIELHSGEAAIFGYGSLILKSSVEKTLGETYVGPFLSCAVSGWRRTWDIAMPNSTFFALDTLDGTHYQDRMYPESILYLNVTQAPGINANGVIFVASRAQLHEFDAREWVYDRVRVTDELKDVKVCGGDAYMYVGKQEYTASEVDSPQKAAIRQTYIEIVETGLQEMNEDFRTVYDHTTDQPPPNLVIYDMRVD